MTPLDVILFFAFLTAGGFLVFGDPSPALMIAIFLANLSYWVIVWAGRSRDEGIRKAAAIIGTISAAYFLIYIYLFFWHPNIYTEYLVRRLTAGLTEGSPDALARIRLASGFSCLASIVLLFLWDRIFNRDIFKEKLNKYNLKYPKKINTERYIRKGIKKDLGCYIGYNLNFKQPVYLSERQRLRHIHVLGTTGSGKTVGAIFPLIHQDLIKGRGVIFIDAKGDLENAKIIYKMVKDAGRENDFLFFSIAHPELSQTYNPLQYGNPTQLKDKITGAIEWSEPFYQRICENALQILFMEKGQNPIALKDLYSILQRPPTKYEKFSKFKEENQRNITTLASEIGLLTNSTFAELLENPQGEIDLLDAYKSKKIVYFALDTQSFGATATRLGKMITQDLNTLSGAIQTQVPERERAPMGIFIDEYQAFGTKAFVNCLARGRASGFMITIAHQSIGDLNAIDKAYTQQINENTNTKIFLQSNDPETTQLFSDMVGTYKTTDETHQKVIAGMPSDQIMGTERVVDEYLLGPQIVRELQDFEAVYKYQAQYGKLVLSPFFIDTGDMALPERRKSQTTQGAGQETPPEKPPQESESPESVL